MRLSEEPMAARLCDEGNADWTWQRIVMRESGAVAVLATLPAIPPVCMIFF